MFENNAESKTKWNDLHDQLKNAMQQELSLMRELLANMHQEELSLMLQDQGSWTQVMQQRHLMVERLASLRLDRQETTQKITHLVGVANQEKSLDKILPLEEDITYEIFNLRDQLMILTERMNRQQSRNHHLFEHPEPQLSLPTAPYRAEEPARARRKISVTTYNLNK